MIVDMERSDLSKICKPGSVKIIKKKTVEEYKDLYHYVSLIAGNLKKNIIFRYYKGNDARRLCNRLS